MYGRLRNIWRATPRPVPPNTVILNESPRKGKGSKIPLTIAMRNFLIKLNGPSTWKSLTIPAAGWINVGSKPECLTWGGNVVWVTEIRGKFCRLSSLKNTWDLDPADFNFETTPEYIHKFTSINSKGYLFKLGNGKNAYTPLMRKGGELWVQTALLEFFPELPVKVTTPSGWEYTIVGYRVEGNKVYGTSIGDKPLLLQEGNQFPTSWKMTSIAPPA